MQRIYSATLHLLVCTTAVLAFLKINFKQPHFINDIRVANASVLEQAYVRKSQEKFHSDKNVHELYKHKF